jgi:3-oxoacyl-[acyl-carrier protein] reductase
MLFSLRGLNALITGASGAIGQALARALAEQGAGIAVSGTKKATLVQLAEGIQSQFETEACVLECDLSDAANAKALVSQAEEKMGKIDILVNNAGITRDRLFVRMSEEDLRAVFDINLRAAFILMNGCVGPMSRRDFGRIINISSVVGHTGNVGQANYCASKAALVGMSKAVGLEYSKRGITVNCIAPGAIESAMTGKLSEQAINKFLDKIPMAKLGKPEDIAAACCFLASREASYVTCQSIHVNGGMFSC